MSHPHNWLQRQSPHWVRDGLISADQARQLHQRHPPPPPGERPRTIITVLGALLLGLGVILLFAYNWADMHRYAKLALVLFTLVTAHAAAMKAQGPRQTAAVESLHALGTLLFGAGIWLIAQIYHIDDHYPNAFLAWGLGALALAWALPSVIQALLAAALIITWQATELFDFEATSHGAPWLVLIGLLPLVGRLNSPLLGSLSAGALLGSLGLNAVRMENEAAIVSLLFFGAALSTLGRLLTEARPGEGARAYLGLTGPGFVLIIGGLFVLSFPEAAEELGELAIAKPWHSPWLMSALLLFSALWIGLWWLRRQGGKGLGIVETAMPLGLALFLWLTITPLDGQGVPLSILFNLLFLGVALSMILLGAREQHRHLLRAGVSLVLLLAVVRYLDLFDSLLARALAFFIAGGLLLAGGLLFRRRKQRGTTA